MTYKDLRVALDGPGGAGKSTVAKAVAARAGLVYVDTGALYRTVGLFVRNRGIGMYDTDSIVASLPEIDIDLTYEDGAQIIKLCGEAVGDRIRTEEMSAYASAVSKIPEVRAFLLEMQRTLARRGGVIMDGRDIGTVIMPEAEVKVFMTATAEERARRRLREQLERGIKTTFEEVLENVNARDKQDSEREIAPLRPADDAVVFVNDGYTAEGSAEYVIGLMDEYIKNHGE